MRESFSRVPPLVWAALVGVIIFGFWLWLWYATDREYRNAHQEGLAAHGQFGDAFGSFTAIFTGLALAGLVYTAILQQKQIRSQDKAITIQAKQLEVQEKEIRALTQAEAFNQFFELVRLLTEERDARAAIYKLGDANTPFYQWDTLHKEYAAEVCAQFNLAGIFAKHNPVIKDLIVENYRVTARRLYMILKPQLDQFRNERGLEYCKEFDWLVHQTNQNDGPTS
jgi:hypothetical protein